LVSRSRLRGGCLFGGGVETSALMAHTRNQSVFTVICAPRVV
jgi:hypothetical protein